MANTIIDTVFYTLQAILFWGYCHYALVTPAKKSYTLPFTLVFFYLMQAFRILFINSLYVIIANTAFITICFLVCLTLVYKQSLMPALITSLNHYLFILISENITLPLLSIFFGNDYRFFQKSTVNYLLMQFVVKLIYALLAFLFARVYRKHHEVADNTGYILLFVIAISNTMVYILIDLFAQKNDQDTRTYMVWAVSSLFMYIALYLVFYYRNYMIEQSQKINELAQKEYNEQYYTIVEKSNSDLQILSHDFKNHLIQLENCENMEQVHAYVKNLYPSIRSFDSATVSENKTLNVIISKYNTLCTVKGVEFRYHIESALAFLEAGDLSAILNNLLDNALEASEGSEAKQINLNLCKKNEKLETLIITNSCAYAPAEKNGELVSSKADSKSHGFGLKSMKKTVAKYNGFYEWKYDEEKKEFTTTISFYH